MFKQAGLYDNHNVQLVGDAVLVLDSQLGKRVVRLRGPVSATNYVRLPHPYRKPVPAAAGSIVASVSPAAGSVPSAGSGPSLGLTGEYCYLQLRAVGEKVFTFHLDLITEEGPPVRLSFSNMFKTFKTSGHTYCFPCRIMSTRWTVFALHFPSILRMYSTYAFKALKAVQFCSSLFVRGVFTSPTKFTIRSLPPALALPVPRGALWAETYDWIWLKPVPEADTDAENPDATAATAIATGADAPDSASAASTASAPGVVSRMGRPAAATAAMAGVRGAARSTVGTAANGGLSHGVYDIEADGPLGDVLDADAAAAEERAAAAADAANAAAAAATTALAKARGVLARKNAAASSANTGSSNSNANAESAPARARSTASTATDSSSKGDANATGNSSGSVANELFGPSGAGAVVHPDPLLQLKQVIGFTPRVKGRNVAWAADGQQVLFTSRQLVIAMDTKTGRQRYLDGHTAPVCTLALSAHGLLATGQEGRFPLIRLWDFETMELPEVPLEFQQDPTGAAAAFDALSAGDVGVSGAGAGAGSGGDAMSGMLSPYALAAAGRYAQLIRAQQARFQHLHPLAPYGAALQAAAQTLTAVSHAGAPSAAAAAAFRALPATGDAVCLTTVACDLASLHSVAFGPCFNRETQLMAACGAVRSIIV